MSYSPDKRPRRNLRLTGYDYAQAGAYFVTICAQGRECLFGDVIDNEMALSDAGKMVSQWLMELPSKFPSLVVDSYIVMPNHLHIIIRILDTNTPVGHQDAPTGAPLPQVIQWFKTMTTNEYIRRVRQGHWPPFPGKLWQRNYYERVIHNDVELNAVRQYIAGNPAKWNQDTENPRLW